MAIKRLSAELGAAIVYYSTIERNVTQSLAGFEPATFDDSCRCVFYMSTQIYCGIELAIIVSNISSLSGGSNDNDVWLYHTYFIAQCLSKHHLSTVH
jgi:hypothetical protein